MTLQEYFATQPHGAKAAMARSVGISKTWLSQIITKRRKPSLSLAVAISNYTKSKVSLKSLAT
jgi:DNA-binding transcriptional regulator YdaS (Cro superfamily)